MMNEWFTQYVRTNSAAQQPPPPPNPQQIPVAYQVVEFQRLNKPLVDKIRKYRAEEFRDTVDDDPERAEFWLENTIWLSKYAREYVSTEEISCKQFVNSLNEDIKLLVGILKLEEFVVLVD
ncbi:Protein MCM10 [Gossypium australe]|uniref:Protein MCM10 n=1 Tax=Gossypium australe TaxID=47621 RepID=A0A5B6WQR4_9ROSI|nr:Protein MCM10 [Gossypium australe]